jgi:hypothetical protein
MSVTDEDVTEKVFDALRVLKGIPKSSFRSVVQSQESLSQLHLFMIDSSSSTARDLLLNDSLNAVPTLLGFAGTALLHIQQQPILRTPAADLTAVAKICESLAIAVQLLSSTPSMARRAQQQMLDSRTGAPGRFLLKQQLHMRYQWQG